jgi:hypothetical protein
MAPGRARGTRATKEGLAAEAGAALAPEIERRTDPQSRVVYRWVCACGGVGLVTLSEDGARLGYAGHRTKSRCHGAALIGPVKAGK